MKNRKPWPGNLLDALRLNETLGTAIDYEALTTDQLEGVDYILSPLTERERIILLCRYRDGMTRKEIAERYHITEKRVMGIERKAVKTLKNPNVRRWFAYAAYGYKARTQQVESWHMTEESLFCETKGITSRAHIYYQHIDCLNLPVRVFNALRGDEIELGEIEIEIETVRELLISFCSGSLRSIRNFGEGSEKVVRAALEKSGLLPEHFKIRCLQFLPWLELEAVVFYRLNTWESTACEGEGRDSD